MKKRIVAMLLALIMLLGLLPVSALAAEGSCKVVIGISQGHYYTSNGDETGINKCERTLSVDDSSEHTFGYEFIWNSDAGGKIYNGGWQLCLTVDGKPAEKPNAYVYSNNMAGAKAVIATFLGEELKPGRDASCGARINMGKYPEMDYRRDKTYTLNYDDNVTDDSVSNMPASVSDTNKNGKATFSITDTIPTRDGYDFLGWDENPNAASAAYAKGGSITISTDTTLYAVWQLRQPSTDIPEPTKPSKPPMSQFANDVLVHCENRSNEHADASYQDIYLDTTNSTRYTEVTVNGENVWKDADGEWTYRIKLNKDEYIKAFNKNPKINTTHTDTNPREETYVTWKHDGTSWKLVPAAGQTGTRIGAVIKVKCTPVPTSDEPTLANTDLNLIVKCVTNNAAHSERSMPLKAGTFKMIGTVQEKFCTIEVETAQYVAAFDTGHPGTHTAAKTIRVELYLKKNDSTAKWTNNKSATDNVIEVTCEPKAPTADELKKLEMAVQVKCVVDELQQHKDGYDLLGEYNKDYFVNEPRKVGDDWLCDISYIPDLYVAKFNKAFPNLKHVQNNEKIDPVTLSWDGNSWQPKKQGLVPVTEVYTVTFDSNGGTPVPPKKEVEYGLTATEPAAPEKTGYTFDGWYLGDEKYDFSAAVKQNITLTAKWSPATVYLFVQPVDSGNNPLTGKNALNAATLARAGFTASKFGGYNHPNKEWITVGKMTTALLLPTFPKMTDITGTWLDAVKGELKTGTYTPHADAADFKANISQAIWTKLQYMTDNYSHYGYEGKSEGYHLDGKLTFYWVKFDGNGATLESMPKNNYGDVYDYYITGGKVTMPAAPTRDGYTFDGWYLDGAEAPFDFNTTITSDITLKAKWKLNTYIIASTLRVNNGDPVKDEGKTYSWSHRYGDDFGVTIDYTDMFKTLKEKALEVDAANKPCDAEIELRFPGDKNRDGKLFNKTILTYGQAGGGWNPGVKNTAYIWGYATTSYEVIFNSNGGSAVRTQIVKYGEKAAKPEDPTMKGYNFLGWFDKDGNPFDFDTEITHKTELKAQWEKKDYIIASDLRVNNGDPVKDEDKTYAWTHRYGGKYKENIDYQPMFDALKARALKADEANEPNPNKVDVELHFPKSSNLFNEAIQTYGQDGGGWNPGVKNTAYIWGYVYTYYDVTFVTGVDGLTVEPRLVKSGDKATEPAAPTKTGYTFDGWYTDEALTDPFTFDTPITRKTTLYAKWKANTYTVTFNANGGKGTMDDQTFTYDVEQALTANAFTRTGYTFTGWNTAADGTGEAFADKAKVKNLTTKANGVVTLYAQWKANKYTVKFDKNSSSAAGTMEDQSFTYDEAAKALSKNTFSRVGYTFNGWNTKKDGSGTAYTDEQTVKNLTTEANGVVTLYAQWNINLYPFVFDSQDGSAVPTQTVAHGSTATKPADPTRAGYWFDGWYTDKTFKTKYNFSTPVTGPTTVYARWSMIIIPSTITKKNPKLNTYDHFAYVQGYPDGTVKPAGNITRAETAAILFRLMDNSSRKTYLSTKSGFRDVTAGSWYNTYVATLNNAGVITDSANGYFRPNEAITRAELAAMLASFTETTRAANYFDDVSANHWAAKAIAICAKLGWITGYPDGSFRPDRNVTRAELMAMINRATGRAPKSADAFLPGMKTWCDNTADKWYYLDVQEATNSHSYAVSPTELWTALTAAPDWSRYE